MPSAYFDVDGTLVGTSLLHPTAVLLANQQSPQASFLRVGRALLDGPRMALAELRDRRAFNEILFSHYKGITEDRLVVLSEEVFDTTIKPRIFPGTRDLLDKCRAAGLRIVLITGNLDTIVGPLARYLGADHVIANKLEIKDRVCTGALKRPVVAGPTKARLIADDARAQGHDLGSCHAYSDSYSDVPMLSVVGHPAAVQPDARLLRLARAYSWPVLDLQNPSREAHTRSGPAAGEPS